MECAIWGPDVSTTKVDSNARFQINKAVKRYLKSSRAITLSGLYEINTWLVINVKFIRVD